jgi:hypothetical protein
MNLEHRRLRMFYCQVGLDSLSDDFVILTKLALFTTGINSSWIGLHGDNMHASWEADVPIAVDE